MSSQIVKERIQCDDAGEGSLDKLRDYYRLRALCEKRKAQSKSCKDDKAAAIDLKQQSRYYKDLAKLVRSDFRQSQNEFIIDKHKTFVGFLDVLFIAAILFNLGAFMLTNVMVVKLNPDIQFYEANPVVAEKAGFQSVSSEDVSDAEKIRGMIFFFVHFVVWLGFVIYYVSFRSMLVSSSDLRTFATSIFVLFVFLGFDFFNDFAYYIGKLMVG